jgi:hypothetical protein
MMFQIGKPVLWRHRSDAATEVIGAGKLPQDEPLALLSGVPT